MNQIFNRRDFCTIVTAIFSSVTVANSCRRMNSALLTNDGRLTARPHAGIKPSKTGRLTLGLERERDAILFLPKVAVHSAVPLLVMLHGATQSAERMFHYLGTLPEDNGVAILAPNSRNTTWDAINGEFGEDVEHLNLALARTFETVEIDPKRLAIGGFSDGASYAISLGLINGDLFRKIVAYSPGFVVAGARYGKPVIFISHGTRDHILPIDSCGRRVAADLKRNGYEVSFREFDGGHEVPNDVALEGLQFVLA